MTEPVPMRIGDAERADAAGALQEHFALGRLDDEELEERSAALWRARYADDLRPLFDDLPAPHPAVLLPGSPTLGVDWNARREVPARRPRGEARRKARNGAMLMLLVMVFVLTVTGEVTTLLVVLPLVVMWSLVFSRSSRR